MPTHNRAKKETSKQKNQKESKGAITNRDLKETPIMGSILDNLVARGILAWRHNNIPAPRFQGGSFAGFRKLGKGLAGAPDIFVYHRGALIGIEVKRAVGGEWTPEQILWKERIVRAGGIYMVANSWEVVADAWATIFHKPL